MDFGKATTNITKQARKVSGTKGLHPCQGFALCSVITAFLAVCQAEKFEDAVINVVQLGQDTDTCVIHNSYVLVSYVFFKMWSYCWYPCWCKVWSLRNSCCLER
mmetsp:Transcript_19631/g.21840  ORF Transcript_19631/g.21840 Transcript_19631/m.21840 type:complete len:104 (-) Transcript_19631:2-313(-)